MKMLGNIFKGVLFKGRLSKAILLFNERPKSRICIELKLLSGEKGKSTSFYTNKIKSVIDLGLDTIDGTIVSVSIHSLDDKYKVTEVWLSVLWVPDISNAEIEQHLIKNLIGGLDEGI